jgi:transposase
MARGRPQFPSSVRDTAICALYRKGITLKAIGQQFGLSYEAIRKITAKAGLTKLNAGLAVRKAAKSVVDKSEIACRRTYGCSLQERAGVADAERRAFLHHRKNVRRSGAIWCLSLKEWRAVWFASGKLDRRGPGALGYGMTRIDFNGPMEVGNVEIVTNREAVRRARARTVKKASRGARPMVISTKAQP